MTLMTRQIFFDEIFRRTEDIIVAKNLVILESPAKVKTVKKFLGQGYEVMASNGHVRDLPKSTLGIGPETGYEPKYITIRGKGDILASLRKEVKKADKIYLATDPDREGEAISWHLIAALKLEDKKVYRITFNEITKNAVKEALKNPREIDMNMVDAQQARRCLDRMVGYRISPLLWAKVKRGLSAGRVQSVALRIVADREDEIAAFVPEEYWTIDAFVSLKGAKNPIVSHFHGDENGKITIRNKKELDEIMSGLKGKKMTVASVKSGERMKKPPLPFTTSTLQQEASKALNFSTQKTMRIAQQLYEGVDIKGQGTVGLITYLRTDSTRISTEAEEMAKTFILESYGENFLGNIEAPKAKEGKKIQDAHEAIRPTDLERTPQAVKDSLSRDQQRLYTLIWKRFVASRMAAAKYETISAKLSAGSYCFTSSESRLAFDGFMSVYVEADDKDEAKGNLPYLSADTVFDFVSYESEQHFTQPPAHFTEANLVHAMEELGIGRPSTYAPTITTILARHYILKENRSIFVTDLGEVVNNIMKEEFPSIVDVNFTANMETLLDGIEEGTVPWKTVIENFYPDLDEAVNLAEKELEHVSVADEVSEEICDKCGRNMVIKYGPHGKFLACPGFPECKNTMPYFEKTGILCPVCGKDIVVKKTRKGRRYYGCIGSSECGYMVWQKPKMDEKGVAIVVPETEELPKEEAPAKAPKKKK